MLSFRLGQVLRFDPQDGHPDSEIVGIDHYTADCLDKHSRCWESYTLVPVDTAKRQDIYKRWYTVDLPDLGMSFVRVVEARDLPQTREVESKLSGYAVINSEGDASLGTNESILATYWDNEKQMWAEERFPATDEMLYFKTNALKGPVCVVG